MRAALALSPGVRGGRARTALSVAGTINGGTATGSTVMVEYVFLKGAATACRVPTVLNRNTSNGHFTGEVDTERCPADLFDGSDVTVRVEAGGATVATGPVNPVPYARYADQVGVNNDCPAGYVRDASATPGIVCARTVTLGAMPVRDEVVKVGVGASAFWVDRYEATIHDSSTGVPLVVSNPSGGVMEANLSTRLRRNGQRQRGMAPIEALSHIGQPSVTASWFQANEACRAAGKRLPTADEWLAAASGTVDDRVACNLETARARAASPSGPCVSAAGAHDMIGNVQEWTAEWYAGVARGGVETVPGTVTPGTNLPGGEPAWTGSSTAAGWPTEEFGGNSVSNVSSAASQGAGQVRFGIPSAATRGGYYGSGARGGVFTFGVDQAPTANDAEVGFRCVVPR